MPDWIDKAAEEIEHGTSAEFPAEIIRRHYQEHLATLDMRDPTKWPGAECPVDLAMLEPLTIRWAKTDEYGLPPGTPSPQAVPPKFRPIATKQPFVDPQTGMSLSAELTVKAGDEVEPGVVAVPAPPSGKTASMAEAKEAAVIKLVLLIPDNPQIGEELHLKAVTCPSDLQDAGGRVVSRIPDSSQVQLAQGDDPPTAYAGIIVKAYEDIPADHAFWIVTKGQAQARTLTDPPALPKIWHLMYRSYS